MPRINRLRRGVVKEPCGLWPPPKNTAIARPAVHAASNAELARILRRLESTRPTREDRFRRFGLQGLIYQEISQRLQAAAGNPKQHTKLLALFE